MSQGSMVTFRCVGDSSVDDLMWQTEGPGQYISTTTYRKSGLMVSSLSMTAHPQLVVCYNMTFLTASDSGWPGLPSSTPACVPPCEDGLHPGGGNGTGWKGTLALETKCTITHITYVSLSVPTGIVGGTFLDCANLDCANIHYLIQNEAISKKVCFTALQYGFP